MLCFFFLNVGDGIVYFFFFQAEDGIRDKLVTGVQTCALPIWALAVATGVKLANHELTVVVTGGDGDGFGIGGNHFIHTMRRNVDLLYLAMDNQIYGLTTGQTSPTSQLGMKTKSAPHGNIEQPINPIALALAAGATFIARGFSGEQKR